MSVSKLVLMDDYLCMLQFKMISKIYMNNHLATGNSPKRIFVQRAVPDTPQDDLALDDANDTPNGMNDHNSFISDDDNDIEGCSSSAKSDTDHSLESETDSSSGDDEACTDDCTIQEMSDCDRPEHNAVVNAYTREAASHIELSPVISDDDISPQRKRRKRRTDTRNAPQQHRTARKRMVPPVKQGRYSAVGAALASLSKDGGRVRAPSVDSALSTTGWIVARGVSASCEYTSEYHSYVVSAPSGDHRVPSQHHCTTPPVVVQSKFFHKPHRASTPPHGKGLRGADCPERNAMPSQRSDHDTIRCSASPSTPHAPCRAVVSTPVHRTVERGHITSGCDVLVPETPDAPAHSLSTRSSTTATPSVSLHSAAVMPTPIVERRMPSSVSHHMAECSSMDGTETGRVGKAVHEMRGDTDPSKRPLHRQHDECSVSRARGGGTTETCSAAGGGCGATTMTQSISCKTTGWISVAPRHRQRAVQQHVHAITSHV